jgi:hypothetical protein
MMGKDIREDGTSCISFRPSILDVCLLLSIVDTIILALSYLLIKITNSHDPLGKVVDH